MGLGYLMKLFGKRNNPTIRRVVKGKNPCQAEDNRIDKLEKRVQTVKNDRERIKGEKRELESLVDDLQAAENHPKAKYWNEKFEPGVVTYRRPIYDGYDTQVEDIPVTVFVQPNDLRIRKSLREEDLMVENPMKLNEAVPDIYHHAKENYRYQYDSNNLNSFEYWLFPFETRHLDGDCEDWSHVIASHLIAAGVPSWRVRVVAGGTLDDNYEGHNTVYVLGDDLETWHHLNSTTPEQHHPKLEDYPEWGEDKGLNIDPNDVWLAYNDRYAWQDFGESVSASSVESSEYSDSISVEEP